MEDKIYMPRSVFSSLTVLRKAEPKNEKKKKQVLEKRKEREKSLKRDAKKKNMPRYIGDTNKGSNTPIESGRVKTQPTQHPGKDHIDIKV